MTDRERIERYGQALRACPGSMAPHGEVVEKLLEPIERILEEQRMDGRDWVTFREALRITGRSAGYFEAPQKRLGGRSRLEAWAADGLAEQTEEGIWLIHRSVLEPHPAAPDTPKSDPGPSTGDIIDRLS